MTGWTWQAWFGLIGGGLIFAAVLVPILLVQVRRYGALSFPRLLGAAAVSVYAVALVAYTLLPIPEVRANCGAGGGGLELVPGHSIGDILRETEGMSLLRTLTSRATLQVVLNVALFVPFGVIARRYWHRGPAVSILLGALLSLAIETTQLTGVWGLFECAYRVADVDDLIANTAGAAIGVLIAPVVLAWMPSAKNLRAERRTPRRVTVWRRWFGMILDAVAVQIAITVVSLVVLVPKLVVSGGTGPGVPENLTELSVIGVGAVILVVVLPAVVSTGASIGQRLVWLAPEWPDGRRPLGRRLARAGVVGVPYTLATTLGQLPEPVSDAAQTVSGVVAIVSAVVVAIAVVSVPFSRGRRGLSLVLAGGELRDSRA
ncbi:VanZ family protein [Microbacterium sp. 1.5R]|uniref:VanZ family protein n=1 Tax=Microbacterium sp. 1.5R TaxID=1916917 RepID=UPI001642E5FD|nr:VanZ family protein [Microbacterium sp. 1.5R]